MVDHEAEAKIVMDKIYDVFKYYYDKLDNTQCTIQYDNVDNMSKDALQLTKIFFNLVERKYYYDGQL